MDEIKVKVKSIDLIRPKLAGVYFLLQDGEVVFIGEHKDIRRQVEKHAKRGLQFDTVGITPFDDNARKRKSLKRSLIDKYRPRDNKFKDRKAASRKRKPRLRGKPLKKASPTKSRAEITKPTPQPGPTNNDQPAKDSPIISTEARESLIAWTQQLTQEAYAEMDAIQADQTGPQVDPAGQPDQTGTSKRADKDSSDLPEWLQDLADETLFGDIPLEDGETAAAPEFEDTLPDWALGSSALPTRETQTEPSARQKEDQEDIPEWLSDIDVDRPGGKSPSPFA